MKNWKIISPETYRIKTTSGDLIYSPDNSQPFTGRMQDTLSNTLIAEYEVVNGIKQGEFTLLTLDGNFAIHGYMNKNKNDGTWKYFYDSGELECTGDFDNDVPVSKWTWFYKNGMVKTIGTFLNGEPDGRWIKFNDEGITTIIINYSNGEVVSQFQIAPFVKA
jgi:antitoxin component YwqK of YwqJK toxin-antitoxin module